MSAGRDRLVVGTVVAAHSGPTFLFAGVAVALPDLGARLGAGALGLGLVETTFLVGGAIRTLASCSRPAARR